MNTVKVSIRAVGVTGEDAENRKIWQTGSSHKKKQDLAGEGSTPPIGGYLVKNRIIMHLVIGRMCLYNKAPKMNIIQI